MFPGGPGQSQIVGSHLTANGTLLTVPAGNTLTANIHLSAAMSALLGTCEPVVTVQGTNAAPTSGTVLAKLTVTGLTAAAVSDSESFEVLVKAPPENDITLVFTKGASGTSHATLNGWLFT